MQTEFILASSSKYRRELLSRLGVTFSCHPAQIDEAPKPEETPEQTCVRLARTKGEHVAKQFPQAVVIASDQVANLDGQAISKPNQHEKARSQLRQMSGKLINFHTAVCVIQHSSKQVKEFCVLTKVKFRELSAAEIERYLLAEKPYDCAGSAKVEGLGISLLDRIETTDPTALIGLPLIQLAQSLRELGLHLP